MKYTVYEKGVLACKSGNVKCGSVGSFRGKVKCFSLSSRRRMREWLLTRSVSGCFVYGVTLTIPSKPLDEVKTEGKNFARSAKKIFLDFRVSLQRFFVYFKRCFPNDGCIWRVELQRSSMPHLHLVSYHHEKVDSSSWLSLWSSCVIGVFPIPSLSSFSRHGVKVDLLDGNISAFRYICDHGSKRKSAQLGWIGRQWGVLNRKCFSPSPSFVVDIPDSLLPRFLRDMSRIQSARVKSDCVFGSRKWRRRKCRFKVSYISRDTVIKWLGYYGLIDKKVSIQNLES